MISSCSSELKGNTYWFKLHTVPPKITWFFLAYSVLFHSECDVTFSFRCSPGRGYRLPTSALVNLSHGSRSENGNQKLTAIVKPQPAVNQSSNLSISSGHLGVLNHSPQSIFVPSQVRLSLISLYLLYKSQVHCK